MLPTNSLDVSIPLMDFLFFTSKKALFTHRLERARRLLEYFLLETTRKDRKFIWNSSSNQ